MNSSERQRWTQNMDSSDVSYCYFTEFYAYSYSA